MSSSWTGRRVARGIIVGCVLAGCAGAPSPAMAAAAAPAPSAATVDTAARANGKSEAQIRKILADVTARVNSKGRIHYVEPARTLAAPAPAAQLAPLPYAQTFTLHSRPGSNRVIYLDFTGETIAGTAWNGAYGTSATSFYAEPFSLDATSDAFSTAEQDIIQSVWQRVAEDYAPFDVDVTTQDPGAAAIDRVGSADTAFGTRALITDATEIKSSCSCGGVAYLGVFDATSSHAAYQPAFVFPESLGDSAKNIAEATTHEVGHNFDLSHDGTASVGYYTGHGAWAPIMGVGYSRPVVQWSKGEYSGANMTQDDLAIIPANGAALLADDAGDTTATAVDLGNGPSATFSGIITTDADLDMLKINAGAGPATFALDPAPNSPNLDAQLKLLNSAGTVVATSNPASAMTNADLATGLNAPLSATLPSAGTYYLAVDGVGALAPASTGYSGYGSIGRYTLSANFTASGTVVGNQFAAATVVSGSSGSTTATNVGATTEAGEPNHAGIAGGKSIWYSWTAPANGTARFETTGSAIDTLLAVYTGSAVNALTAKASNDDNGAATTSLLSFAATAGTLYRIAIDGKAGAAGALKLAWDLTPAPPANDAFGSATAISGTSGTIAGTTAGATKEAGEPSHAGVAGARSVWYSWTAPATGPVTIDTIGSAFDTLLGVYTGTAVSALTAKASNDDSGGAQSKLTFAATAGTTYRIAVDGKAGAAGAVTLRWDQFNDNLAAARVIGGQSGTATATTVNATRETGEPTHGGSGGARSIWFAYTAPKAGTLTIDTFGSGFDTLLGGYTGTAVNALTLKKANDDAGGGYQSQIAFAVTSGTVYRIAVDGYGGASGAVTLHWSLP